MSRKFGVEDSRQRVGMQVGKEVPKGGAGFRGKGRWMSGQGGSRATGWPLSQLQKLEKVEGSLGFSGP